MTKLWRLKKSAGQRAAALKKTLGKRKVSSMHRPAWKAMRLSRSKARWGVVPQEVYQGSGVMMPAMDPGSVCAKWTTVVDMVEWKGPQCCHKLCGGAAAELALRKQCGRDMKKGLMNTYFFPKATLWPSCQSFFCPNKEKRPKNCQAAGGQPFLSCLCDQQRAHGPNQSSPCARELFQVKDGHVAGKASVYACPFCAGSVASDVKTGHINHRTVCGNQFSVKDGQVAKKASVYKAKSLRSVSIVWSLARGSLETRTKMIAWPRLRLAGRGMMCTGCAKQGWSLAKGSAKARRQCQGKAKSLRSVSSVWSLANSSLETRTKMPAWPRLRLAGRKKMCKGCSKQAEPWQTAAPRQGGSAKARLSLWEAFQAFEAWQTAVTKPAQKWLPDPG